jgi:hypothetical protein
MRLSRRVDVERRRNPLSVRDETSGLTGDCQSCPFAPAPPLAAVSSPAAVAGPIGDWIDSQANVLGLWLDRLIADGDPGDLISLVHRQHAWLELLRARIRRD